MQQCYWSQIVSKIIIKPTWSHLVERMYLRQKSFDGSVNKTILKPRLDLAARHQWDFPDVKLCVAALIRYRRTQSGSGIRIPDYDPDRAQKLISLSMFRHLSTRNISSKSMHAFLSNLANRQTDRQTNKVGQNMYLLLGVCLLCCSRHWSVISSRNSLPTFSRKPASSCHKTVVLLNQTSRDADLTTAFLWKKLLRCLARQIFRCFLSISPARRSVEVTISARDIS